jgi:predicted nicotinamide N-methyase
VGGDRGGTRPPRHGAALLGPCLGGRAGAARYILDNPALVAGRRVLDLAAGGGIVGLAALRAGAARVDFNDIDPLAGAAIQLNAEANDLISGYTLILSDLLGEQSGVGSGARPSLRSSRGKWDVVLTGDTCYERDMAALMLAWLRDRSGEGALALIAYDVPTDLDLEDSTQRRTHVLRVDPV